MAGRLGIIAGGGDLPLRLAETCHRDGRALVVLALEGHAEPDRFPSSVPIHRVRLGAAGTMLDIMQAEQVKDIVLVGRVRRPSLAELRPDWRGAQLLAKIGRKALGDDGLLRAVAEALSEEGFRVVGVQEIMTELLTPLGILTAKAPDQEAKADIVHGVRVARILGSADVGQAVIVQDGLVLGVEAIEGTDALIARCGALRREGLGPVLIKVRKPDQDRRLDLPTIGIETVRQAHANGLRGIALEAKGTLCLDRMAVIAAADALGIWIVGVDADAGGTW